MSKASESCIISEAEGCKVPIEVQSTYEDFMEMYDYTKFIGFATKSFVPELLCAVSIDSTIVKHVASDTVPAKLSSYEYHCCNFYMTKANNY